jgi:hypothetical protein
MPWRAVILEYVSDLRDARRSDSLMDEVENRLREND